jgi:hypothetical protein
MGKKSPNYFVANLLIQMRLLEEKNAIVCNVNMSQSWKLKALEFFRTR